MRITLIRLANSMKLLVLILFMLSCINLRAEEISAKQYDILACQNLKLTDVELLQCVDGQLKALRVELPDSAQDIAEVQTRVVANEFLQTLKAETTTFLEESEATLLALRECQRQKDQDLYYKCKDPEVERMITSIRTILPQMRLHMALAREGQDPIKQFGDTTRDYDRNFVSQNLKHPNTGASIPSLSARELKEAETLFRSEVRAYRNQYLKERHKQHCLELDPDEGVQVITGEKGCDHIQINNTVNQGVPSIRSFHKKEYERIRENFPFLAYINMQDPGDVNQFSRNLNQMISGSLIELAKEKKRVRGLSKKSDLEDLFTYRVPASRALNKVQTQEVKSYLCRYAQDHLDYLYNINLATEIGIGIVGAAGALTCGATILCGAAVGVGTEALLLARQNRQYEGTLDSFRLGLVDEQQVTDEKNALELTIALTPVFAIGGEAVAHIGGRAIQAGKSRILSAIGQETLEAYRQRVDNLIAQIRRPKRAGNIDSKIVLSNASLSPNERLAAASKLLGIDDLSADEPLGEALLKAHEIGGPLASVYRYTDEELTAKIDLLLKSGYSPEQAKKLIRYGLVGKKGGGIFSSVSSLFRSKSALEQLQDPKNSRLQGAERVELENMALKENGLNLILELFPNELGTQARIRESLIPALRASERSTALALESLQSLPGDDYKFLIREAGYTPKEIIDALKLNNNTDELLKIADTRAALKKIKSSGAFEGAFDRFPIGNLERNLLEKNLLGEIFPEKLFPSGSIRMNNQGTLIFSDELSENALSFLSKMKPTWNEAIQNADKAATSPAQRTRLLMQELGVQNNDLLVRLQRESFDGALHIPTRKDSWEEVATTELLRDVLGIKPEIDSSFLQVDPSVIPVEHLESLSKVQTKIKALPTNLRPNQAAVQAQGILNDEFYTPELVRASLKDRAALVPTNASELSHRAGGDDWMVLDIEDLRAASSNPKTIGDLGPKGTTRRVYRNTETGQSIVENINPDGSVHSMEMIVARDPQDPTKGVTFFNYEEGKLSNRFTNQSHGNNKVGFDCMQCHGARKRNRPDEITSSFIPLGMSRRVNVYDRAMVHPSIEQLDILSTDRSVTAH